MIDKILKSADTNITFGPWTLTLQFPPPLLGVTEWSGNRSRADHNSSEREWGGMTGVERERRGERRL